MTQKTFTIIAGVIFLLVTIVHMIRLIVHWEVVVAGYQVPLWVSWIGIVVFGYLAWSAFAIARRNVPRI